jgi:alpha-tubulin suppressor-like RCC1 family protein
MVSSPLQEVRSHAAIKTDGTLWTWGYNGDGELGLNDTNVGPPPVQVGALNRHGTKSQQEEIIYRGN